MKKKRPQVKEPIDLKAFVSDLIRIDRKLLFAFVTVFVLLVFVSQTPITVDKTGTIFGIKTSILEQPTINSFPRELLPALYPQKSTDVPAPKLTSASAIVIDGSSQVILYEKNGDVRFPPASTTKIMTALVAMEVFALSDILTVPAITTPPANMGLRLGEKISFENVLLGLLIASGNDAAETIVIDAPGGKAAFIDAMNEKAESLNLFNTHFANVSGLESENHYTTALDLARLASFALKNKRFAEIVATRTKVVGDLTGTIVHPLENINKLLGSVEGANGVKTGFTQEAGQVLVSSATRDNNTIVCVVLKSEDRFLDSQNLLEWAFANHTFTEATRF